MVMNNVQELVYKKKKNLNLIGLLWRFFVNDALRKSILPNNLLEKYFQYGSISLNLIYYKKKQQKKKTFLITYKKRMRHKSIFALNEKQKKENISVKNKKKKSYILCHSERKERMYKKGRVWNRERESKRKR